MYDIVLSYKQYRLCITIKTGINHQPSTNKTSLHMYEYGVSDSSGIKSIMLLTLTTFSS